MQCPAALVQGTRATVSPQVCQRERNIRRGFGTFSIVIRWPHFLLSILSRCRNHFVLPELPMVEEQVID